MDSSQLTFCMLSHAQISTRHRPFTLVTAEAMGRFSLGLSPKPATPDMFTNIEDFFAGVSGRTYTVFVENMWVQSRLVEGRAVVPTV
jgi:hypothetical protein